MSASLLGDMPETATGKFFRGVGYLLSGMVFSVMPAILCMTLLASRGGEEGREMAPCYALGVYAAGVLLTIGMGYCGYFWSANSLFGILTYISMIAIAAHGGGAKAAASVAIGRFIVCALIVFTGVMSGRRTRSDSLADLGTVVFIIVAWGYVVGVPFISYFILKTM